MLRESNVARNVAALHCPARGRSRTVTPAFPVRLPVAAAIGIANDRSRVGYIHCGSAVFSSPSQFVDAQLRPQPIEVVTRHFIIAAGEFDRVVFERLEPIDDLGATLCGFYGGARRLVPEHGDWLIEQVPIVPVQTTMNNRAALLFGQVRPGWRRRIARCHALFERLAI